MKKKNSTMCSHLNNHLFTNQMMNSEHLDVFISTIRIFRSISFCPVTQLHFWPLSVHFLTIYPVMCSRGLVSVDIVCKIGAQSGEVTSLLQGTLEFYSQKIKI